MISQKRIITCIVISIFTTTQVTAQKQWSLDDCIRYAINNNLDIKSQHFTTETYKEYLAQAKRNRLPSINAGSGYSTNYGKSIDPNTNDIVNNKFASNSYSLSGSVLLFRGFIRKNQIDYQRFSYLAGIADYSALKNEIAFNVMNSFYNSLYLKGLVGIVEKQKELSEMNLNKVKKQAEVGISAKTDILEIEARLADEELSLIRTKNELIASILDLKQAMNYPISDELLLKQIPENDLIQAVDFEKADSVYNLALEYLPEVKSKYMQLKAVEEQLAISKGVLSPSLSASGSYSTGYNETSTIVFNEQLKNNASQSVGLSLSIPIFNRWQSRSDIKLSKLALEKEKVDLENFKKQLYYEIESYCQDLSAVSAEYLQSKKQTESNQLAFEVAENKKKQGMISIVEFYTVKNQLSTAQGELLRTLLEYQMKRKTIDFYLGKPVFGILNDEQGNGE